jgi:nitrogen fixation NifU-like protein
VSADLYQDLIVDHGKRPRNFGPLPGADRTAEGVNPLCGDELSLRLKVSSARIEQIAFEGVGCAVCIASASLMTVAVAGCPTAHASLLAADVAALVEGGPVDEVRLGDLMALSGVARFPARRKCALLAWRALEAALADADAKVTTE